jgi:hypothetical protein
MGGKIGTMIYQTLPSSGVFVCGRMDRFHMFGYIIKVRNYGNDINRSIRRLRHIAELLANMIENTLKK